jgi:hypothetical protein
MVSRIPPKERETAKLTYYTKGEVEKALSPAPFRSHVAEPGGAARIIDRNPSHFEDFNVKPQGRFIRTGGYTPGLYAGRSQAVAPNPQPSSVVTSLSEAKIQKKREFSE